MTSVTYLDAAAETVRIAYETEREEALIRSITVKPQEEAATWFTEHHEVLTQLEFNAIPTYQTTVPTNPRPGFRYKRFYGPSGPLQITAEGDPMAGWFVFTVEPDPIERYVLLHTPRKVAPQ